MIKTKALYFNLLLTIFAIGLHAYLAQKFFALQNAESSGQSFCNLGGLWNCDAVNTSPYSRLFGNPIALWGFATHLVFLLCQVMVLAKKRTDDVWADLTVYLSLLIAGTSVVMGYITITQVGSFCLFCITAYVLSLGNLVVLKIAGFQYLASLKNFINVLKQSTSWILAASIPLLVFVIGSNWRGPQSASQVEGIVSDKMAAWTAAPASQFDMNLGLRLGAQPENTKMTIIEFADFRCPHCKHAAPSIKAFVQSRKDVALIFKAYPLDGTCNLDPGFNGQGDGISCRLAFAVVCAEKLEQKGWKLYDNIFENQTDYQHLGSIDQVDQKLCTEGISDCEKFKSCMSDDETKNAVQKMAQEATQAGLKGTPTFFINNKLLNSAQYLPVLEKAYSVIKDQ
jgi:protein-disulfide isomerase/uncharacterized membrane protein